MNINEINDDFDREYERYMKDPANQEGFVKLKMPTYYIAKHSDEDLQAAVLAEREACAKLCDDMGNKQTNQCLYDPWDCASSIRARGEK